MTGDTGKVAANVGETTYTLTVTGKNNDSGTVNKTWKIQPKSITDTSVSAGITGGIETQPSSFCYNASEQTPTLTVTDNGIGSGAVTLVKDTRLYRC